MQHLTLDSGALTSMCDWSTEEEENFRALVAPNAVCWVCVSDLSCDLAPLSGALELGKGGVGWGMACYSAKYPLLPGPPPLLSRTLGLPTEAPYHRTGQTHIPNIQHLGQREP